MAWPFVESSVRAEQTLVVAHGTDYLQLLDRDRFLNLGQRLEDPLGGSICLAETEQFIPAL
jgi:hypothetical protein